MMCRRQSRQLGKRAKSDERVKLDNGDGDWNISRKLETLET